MRLKCTFLFALLLMLIFPHHRVVAQTSVLSSDSIQKLAAHPDFIRASLLYITPGTALYSTTGHSAMRLECPTHGLDYCFTFENRPSANIVYGFVTGSIKAHYLFHKTDDFIHKFKEQGRGVYAVALNLTPSEKQELWKFLDAEESKTTDWTYNYLHYNCSSMMLYAIHTCLNGEDKLDFHDLTPWLSGSNRYILQEIFRNSPWSELFWNMVLGTEGELTGNTEGCMAPKFLFDEMQKATFTSADSTVRKAVTGLPVCLLEASHDDTPNAVTPTMVCIILLVLAVVVTLYDLFIKRGYSMASRIVDVAFTTIVTSLGLVYAYMILFSPQVGTSWNWLAVAFNPLFLVAWCCLRKKAVWMRIVYSVATAALVGLVLATPVLPQLQTSPLAWLFMAFAVRTLSQALPDRVSK